jgi:hypothetical protein
MRQGEAETHHRGAAHPSPQRKVEWVIADVGCVPRRRAEARDNQQIAAISE